MCPPLWGMGLVRTHTLLMHRTPHPPTLYTTVVIVTIGCYSWDRRIQLSRSGGQGSRGYPH